MRITIIGTVQLPSVIFSSHQAVRVHTKRASCGHHGRLVDTLAVPDSRRSGRPSRRSVSTSPGETEPRTGTLRPNQASGHRMRLNAWMSERRGSTAAELNPWVMKQSVGQRLVSTSIDDFVPLAVCIVSMAGPGSQKNKVRAPRCVRLFIFSAHAFRIAGTKTAHGLSLSRDNAGTQGGESGRAECSAEASGCQRYVRVCRRRRSDHGCVRRRVADVWAGDRLWGVIIQEYYSPSFE